jgi:hypothetical protein
MVFLGMLFFATLGYGQDSLAAPSQEAAAIAHGAFPAKVTKTLDSSKLKQDDSIEVERAGSFKLSDGTLVPERLQDDGSRRHGEGSLQRRSGFRINPGL